MTRFYSIDSSDASSSLSEEDIKAFTEYIELLIEINRDIKKQEAENMRDLD